MTLENPFSRISIMILVLLFFLGIVIDGFFFSTLKGFIEISDETETNLSSLFIDLWMLYWIYRASKQANIDIRLFLQRGHRIGMFSLLGLVIALILFSIGSSVLVTSFISYILPSLSETFLLEDEKSSVSSFPVFNQALDYLSLIVMAPVVEELLFRGIILNRLATKWGLRKAILISSAMFAVLHLAVLGAFLFAICMSILYIKSRTLLVPMAAHAINNGFVVLLGMWSSPNTESEVSSSDESMSALVWAGVVLIAMTMPVLVEYVRRNWPQKDAQPPYVFEMNERFESIEYNAANP